MVFNNTKNLPTIVQIRFCFNKNLLTSNVTYNWHIQNLFHTNTVYAWCVVDSNQAPKFNKALKQKLQWPVKNIQVADNLMLKNNLFKLRFYIF